MSGEGPFPEDAGVSSDSSVPGDLSDDESDEDDEPDLTDESDEPSYEMLGAAGNPFDDTPPPEDSGPSADGATRPGTDSTNDGAAVNPPLPDSGPTDGTHGEGVEPGEGVDAAPGGQGTT